MINETFMFTDNFKWIQRIHMISIFLLESSTGFYRPNKMMVSICLLQGFGVFGVLAAAAVASLAKIIETKLTRDTFFSQKPQRSSHKQKFDNVE